MLEFDSSGGGNWYAGFQAVGKYFSRLLGNNRLSKFLAKRGWMIRGVFFLSVGFLGLVYYFSSSFSSFAANNVNLIIPETIERKGNFFSFLYGDESGHENLVGHQGLNGVNLHKVLKSKIVHFDLKGMPPLISYYKALFPVLKEFGATGILMEYEDMFPYSGRLGAVVNREAYSEADVKEIVEEADANDLEVIPLIQTFGHLEFVLKTEKFMDLREVAQAPQAICPTNSKSEVLLKSMVDDIMRLHPRSKRLHIGSDEVYQIGQCSLCMDKMSKHRIGTSELFLDHVRQIAGYVQEKYRVKPLMWDDMFRNMEEKLIVHYNMAEMVEVIVWDYHPDVRISPSVWEKYSRVFRSVWIGSAFKGANEPNSMVANETHYLANHYSWAQTIQAEQSSVAFNGIILTGWQRYDHFAVPCEILPVAIPSLVSCLIFLNTTRPAHMEEVFLNASEALDCAARLDYCRFPGSSLHQAIKHLYRSQMSLQRIKKQNIYLGWANRANLMSHFSSPSYVETLYYEVMSLRSDLERIEVQLDKSMNEIFPSWSTSEWMMINFHPLFQEVNLLFEGLAKVLERRSFPVRPLKYEGEENQEAKV